MQPTPVTTCKNTHIKHTGIGMCCVCITLSEFFDWVKFWCVYFSLFHKGGELGQLLTKAKIRYFKDESVFTNSKAERVKVSAIK